MTDERRQDAVLVALMASAAIHVALMFLISPQVMTHVAPGAVRAHGPKTMTVTAAPEQVEPVKMEVVQDVEAPRESPVAEAEDLVPVAATLAAPEAMPAAMPEVAEIAAPELPEPKPAFAPFMAEKIHVDAADSAFTTPIAPMSAPIASAVSAAPEVGPLVAVSSDVEIPMFTAPVYVPEVKVAETRQAVLPSEPARAPETFVPAPEVLAEVDEKIVEQEKAAVRDLLDVRDAQELAKSVDIVSDSANEGDWTYFRLRINPRAELATVPKDVVILLDASGSIGDDRLLSCRKAAKSILRSVTNTGDRFNLVAFRDRFSYASKNWCACNQSNFDGADKWLKRLAAHGRTDVFSTIRSVLTLPRDPTRPLIAMVVTDGDANTGVSETAQILSKFSALNDGLISVYMYGVKANANRELIDVLTHGNRGESFIFGGSRWNAGRALEGLSERFRDPVLTDLRIVFTSGTKAETYPRLLRNLYRGEVVDLVGRVPRGETEVAFSLRGLCGAKPYEGFFRIDLSQSAFDKDLPAAWRNEKAIDEKLR